MKTISLLLFILGAHICHADELYRVQVDLDGDGKAEVVHVSIAAGQENVRDEFSVQVGSSTYKGICFADSGSIPEFRVVSVDRARKERQLLIMAPESAWCNYHLLGFSGGELIPLVRFESGADCTAPGIHGNGTLSTSTWQGFWFREDLYRLAPEATALEHADESRFSLYASGAAAKAFVLAGDECPPLRIRPNAFLRLTRFDPAQARYRVESLDGGCGWISSDELVEHVKELP